MKTYSDIRIAFIGWNPFQFRHFNNIINLFPGAFRIIEDRQNGNLPTFPTTFFEDYNNPTIVVKKGLTKFLDNKFDVIVAQTVFPGIQQISNSKIVFLQYGYAKEPHNYGAWRSLADLNLSYGPYATQKLQYFSPVVESGNPEHDNWESAIFQADNKKQLSQYLDPNKKTILYAPTWGEISSIDLYLDNIIKLSDDFNLMLKIHHNSDIIENKCKEIKNKKNIKIFGANDDIYSLLTVTDLMISDYSGAIFDALYCKIPIILLDLKDIFNSPKLDKDSIEINKRSILGPSIGAPNLLTCSNIKSLFQVAKDKLNVQLINELFKKCNSNNSKIAAQAILDTVNGKFQLTSVQKYLRDIVKKVQYKFFM
ncbi:MAG: CDP-glycerol glycerophosphotransferase family protein [Desulfovibrionaceae bacterium]|nr:CDP-glycerol glycerophosphotransferase family protein [Desulfovibrionaceae bacterium]